VQLTITLSSEQEMALQHLLDACDDPECSSHGPLTLTKLAQMLLEDAALVVTRPGSWEGANMMQVLQSHGYL
jgi:hypothetical protein